MIDKLFPRIQKYTAAEGTYTLPENPVVLFKNDEAGEIFRIISFFADGLRERAGIDCYPVPDYAGKLQVAVNFLETDELKEESYVIEVKEDGITVLYGEPVAAFRAKETLTQMIELTGGKIPAGRYEDWADVKRRGFMLDVNRGKVPTLDKLKKLVDKMAAFKMNELQLYLEAFAYEYQEHPAYFGERDGLTPFEMMTLDQYAKERYVDLVPNQNSFGHLGLWLAKDEFKHLKGMYVALDPLQDESVEFIDGLYKSLLPCFDSSLVHIGCDEVCIYDETVKKAGREKAIEVFIDFINKINALAEKAGKRPMFWGESVLGNADDTEIVSRVPKNMIPIIWSYGDDKFFSGASEKMSSLGYDFYLCPSTNCWSFMFANLNVARANILDAAEAAVKFRDKGAMGVLIAEWGDFCHLQFDFSVEMTVAYGAGVLWNLEGNRELEYAAEYSDRALFGNTDVKVSRLVQIGADSYDPNYYSCLPRDFDVMDFYTNDRYPRSRETCVTIKENMAEIIREAKRLGQHKGSELLAGELVASAETVDLLGDYIIMRIDRDEGRLTLEECLKGVNKLIERAERIREQIIFLWNKRNKPKGNDTAYWFILFKLNHAKKQLTEKIEAEKSSAESENK
ncbi:MAG: family 20 glycosylhydrolase [Clostridia bacterium]|nr:family 20 glycosylhydrolase [Clostridia bacterium]